MNLSEISDAAVNLSEIADAAGIEVAVFMKSMSDDSISGLCNAMISVCAEQKKLADILADVCVRQSPEEAETLIQFMCGCTAVALMTYQLSEDDHE